MQLCTTVPPHDVIWCALASVFILGFCCVCVCLWCPQARLQDANLLALDKTIEIIGPVFDKLAQLRYLALDTNVTKLIRITGILLVRTGLLDLCVPE